MHNTKCIHPSIIVIVICLFIISFNRGVKDFVLFGEISPKPGHSNHAININKKPEPFIINSKIHLEFDRILRRASERQLLFSIITLKELSMSP